MIKKTLKAEPLTSEAFEGFGDVLMVSGAAPHRDEFAGNIENRRAEARANLTFIHAVPKPPLIGAVERHAFSSQTFVPMNGISYLVGVCPPATDGGPDLNGLVVFVASGGQAVNYDAGVWHSPLSVLDRPGEFVMLRWDDGSEQDTEIIKIKQPVEVQIS